MAEVEKLEEALKAKGFSGLDDIPKVLEALDSAKADINKHKTRASELSKMEQELADLRQKQQEREDQEKTELQKLLDKVAKAESEKEQIAAQAAAAKRTAMLERGLSEHLSAVPEKLRPFASEHLRTVLPGKEWADPETLKSTITESLERFNSLLPEEMKIVPAGGQDQGRKQVQPEPGAGKPVFDFQAALHGAK